MTTNGRQNRPRTHFKPSSSAPPPRTVRLWAKTGQSPSITGQGRAFRRYDSASEIRARRGIAREGDGEDAKLTISFPGHGLKKIVEKYAGIKVEE